ncbi:hypothetical protein [Kitasatospora sp. NPDC051914]|uniref:hypothetical protein n=1 Tax=Kitasatospora sp. NPDC051914 TaxID=3154945 RepID=UPI00342F109A
MKRTATHHRAPRSYRLVRLRARLLSEDGLWFSLLGLSTAGFGLLLGADGVWRLVSTIVRSIFGLFF